MSLFNNKYRIETTRLKHWDYGSDATYFITICTKKREHFFGKVQNDGMVLNSIGNIVQNEWLQTPIIRPDMNLLLDTFVVMPNHFHAIICIGKNEFNKQPDKQVTYAPMNENYNEFSPQSKNLAAIVRGFKSGVTKQAQKINPDFGWQTRFHDHIIRSQESHIQIQNYILNNPFHWKEDTFYTI